MSSTRLMSAALREWWRAVWSADKRLSVSSVQVTSQHPYLVDAVGHGFDRKLDRTQGGAAVLEFRLPRASSNIGARLVHQTSFESASRSSRPSFAFLSRSASSALAMPSPPMPRPDASQWPKNSAAFGLKSR